MREKFFTRIALNLGYNVFHLLVNYVLMLTYDQSLVGIIGLTGSIIGIFSMFIDLGFASIYRQHNADDDFESYFSVLLLLKSIIVLSSFVPLIIGSFFVGLSPTELNFLILNVIFTMTVQITLPWMVNLESKKKMIKFSLIDFSANILQDSLSLLVILNYRNISIPLELIGFALLTGACFKVVLIFLLSRGEFVLAKIDKKIAKEFLKASQPLILYYVATSIIQNLGRLVIYTGFGENALAEYYIVDKYVVSFLILISSQIYLLFSSYFPANFKTGDIKSIQEMTHAVEKYSSILFLGIVLVILPNSALILQLILPEYINSAPYLSVLILVPYFVGISYPYMSHLIPSKRQGLYSKYNFAKAILFILLLVVLVPPELFSIKMLGFGAIGLSFITLFTWGLDVFFYRYFSYRLGIKSSKNTFYHFAFATIALIISIPISIFGFRNISLFSNGFILLLMNSVLAIGIFLILLVVFKQVDKRDVIFILGLFKLSKYKESLKDEIKKNEK